MSNFGQISFSSIRSSLEDIISNLKDGISHPYQSDGKRYLVFLKNGKVHFEDITDILPERWISSAKIGDLNQNVHNLLTPYVRGKNVTDVLGYSLVTLSPGDRIKILPVSGKEGALIVSKKTNGNYFDMVLWFGKSVREDIKIDGMVNYKNRLSPQTDHGDREFIHSGDKGYLLHTVKFNGVSDNRIITIAAVGYDKKYLRIFADQQPCVCLIQHPIPEKDIQGVIYIVPCPLDQESVGNSVYIHLVSGMLLENGFIEYHVPIKPCRSPEGSDQFDTTLENDSVKDLAKSAMKMCISGLRTQSVTDETSAAEGPTIDKTSLIGIPVSGEIPIVEGPVILFQNGTSGYMSKFCGFNRIFWESGYTKNSVSETTGIILPVPCHQLSGSSCALGNLPEVIPAENHRTIVVTYGSTNPNDPGLMQDPQARMVEMKRNALYIVTGPEEIPDTDPERKKLLDNMIMSSVNNMAGSKSIIIYMDKKDRAIWYRGSALPGLFDQIYDYGELVDLSFVMKWMENEGPDYPWPVLTTKKDTRVWIKIGESHIPKDRDEVIGWLMDLSLEQIKNSQTVIRDVLSQLSSVLDQGKIDAITSKVCTHFSDMIDEASLEKKKLFEEAYKSGDVKRIRETNNVLKDFRRKFLSYVQPIFKEISNLSSYMGVRHTGKNRDLQRAIREAKVDANVKDAISMSLESLWDYISEHADDCHIIFLPDENFRYLLELVSNEKLNESLSNGGYVSPNKLSDIPFSSSDRLTYLDTYSCAAVSSCDPHSSELTREGNSLAIPESHSRPDRACLTIPILKKYCDDSFDPRYAGTWQKIANKKLFSTLRIRLRGTLAGGSYRLVEPQSYELGFMLVYMFFAAMRSIAVDMQQPPVTPEGVMGEDVSTNMKAMRSHFVQLLALLGSGKDTCGLHYAHCLFHIGTYVSMPKKPNQWWVYLLMAEYLPYTGWKQDIQNTFRVNMRTLVVNVIWKYVVEKVVKRMNTVTKKKKPEFVKEPELYYYLRQLVEIVMICVDSTNDYYLSPALAKELLDRCPTKISRGTKMMNDFLMIQSNLGPIASLTDEGAERCRKKISHHMMMVATYSFVKHGLCDVDKKSYRKSIAEVLDEPQKMLSIYKNIVKNHSENLWKTRSEDHDIKMKGLKEILDLQSKKVKVTDVPSEDIEVIGDETFPVSHPESVVLSLRDHVSLIPGSEEAVELLDSLSQEVRDPIPGIPIYGLIKACGVPEGRVFEVYRKMVESFISEPKDSESGRAAALTALASS